MLDQQPFSDDLGPWDLSIARLPCGHIFHAACVLDGRLDHTCPLCREAFVPSEVPDLIIGDFDTESSYTMESESEQEAEENQHWAPPIPTWKRYHYQGRAWWYNFDDENLSFWESSPSWTRYHYEGLWWWHHADREDRWFFEHTGCQLRQ